MAVMVVSCSAQLFSRCGVYMMAMVLRCVYLQCSVKRPHAVCVHRAWRWSAVSWELVSSKFSSRTTTCDVCSVTEQDASSAAMISSLSRTCLWVCCSYCTLQTSGRLADLETYSGQLMRYTCHVLNLAIWDSIQDVYEDSFYIGSRPNDHYFHSVCLSVCLCRVFLSRLRSDLDQTRTRYMSGSSCVP